MDRETKPACEPTCLFPTLVAEGDACAFDVTGFRCA